MKQRLLAWLVIVLGMACARGGYLEDVVYNVDEAEYAVAADALAHGRLPGVDLLGSTKPPGVIFLYRLLFDLFGRSLAPVHVVHLAIMVASGILVCEIAALLWGLAAALPAAALYAMTANGFSLPSEMLALNVESPGMLLALLALWLAWRGRGVGIALAAGASLGIGILFRQSIAVFLLPVAAVMCLQSERRVLRLVLCALGVVLPWIPVLAVYAAREGALVWAWDSWVRYPFTYAGDLGLSGFLDALYRNGTEFAVQSPIPLAFAVGGAVLLRRERRSKRVRVVLWLLVASVLALCSGSRFFGHYWIQIFPLLALLGVPAWQRLASGRRAGRLLLTSAVAVGGVIALLHYPLWRAWDPNAVPRGVSLFRLGAEQNEKIIGAFAYAHTRPDETITVWGYCPQIYWHANRLPGVRDYLCHYITGYSPGTFDARTERAIRPYGHPRAQEMLVEDLERREPKYIFDLVQIVDCMCPFFTYSIRSYPQLAAYVREHYVPEGTVGRAFVYRLRTEADTWQPSPDDVR